MHFSFMSLIQTFYLAPDFKSVQKEVSELIKGGILIGHAIYHDLKVIGASWFTCNGYV